MAGIGGVKKHFMSFIENPMHSSFKDILKMGFILYYFGKSINILGSNILKIIVISFMKIVLFMCCPV